MAPGAIEDAASLPGGGQHGKQLSASPRAPSRLLSAPGRKARGSEAEPARDSTRSTTSDPSLGAGACAGGVGPARICRAAAPRASRQAHPDAQRGRRRDLGLAVWIILRRHGNGVAPAKPRAWGASAAASLIQSGPRRSAYSHLPNRFEELAKALPSESSASAAPLRDVA